MYLVEGQQPCWKCRQSTRVIGLGVGEYIHIFDTGDGGPGDVPRPSGRILEAAGGWRSCRPTDEGAGGDLRPGSLALHAGMQAIGK